jgi:DNA-binding MarR family transcriptional regulator
MGMSTAPTARCMRASARPLATVVLAMRDLGHPVDLAQLDAVFAVDEGPDQPGQEVTVGLVADRLGIDPSRASRLVATAIRAGQLRRVASQADGRRIRLELTDAGREITQAAHHSRQALYDRLMRDWSQPDRQQFARLLTRFYRRPHQRQPQPLIGPARILNQH